MQPTNRTYKNHETGQSFRMFQDSITGQIEFHAKGRIVSKGYYVAVFPIEIRTNERTISLIDGEILILEKGERITHTKGMNQKRFVKF